MTTVEITIKRTAQTIFGTEVEKHGIATCPQFDSLAEIASVYTEEQLVALVNHELRTLAQRQGNNDMKAASSGLSETDSAAVKSILKAVQQAKELDDDPVETANRLLAKPKFQHLRAVFEGKEAGTVQIDYTGFELVDGKQVPKLTAPKERAKD